MIKHGKTKAGRLTKKYGPGRDPDEGKPKKKKLKEAKYPKKSRKLAEILPLLTLIKRKLMEGDALVPYTGPAARRDQVRTRGTKVALPTGTQWVDRTQTDPKEKDADFTEVKDKVQGPKVIDVKGHEVKQDKKSPAPKPDKKKKKVAPKKMASSKKKTKDKKSTPATASDLNAAKAKKEKAKKKAEEEKQIKSDKMWGGGAAKIRLVKSVVKRLLPKPGFVRKAHGPVHK
jgi:hypothetical protein